MSKIWIKIIILMIGALFTAFGAVYLSQSLGMLAVTFMSHVQFMNSYYPVMLIKELLGIALIVSGIDILAVVRGDV